MRSRSVALLLAVVLTVALFAGIPQMAGAAEDAGIFAGGSGTEADPYQISTADQLKDLAAAVNGGASYEGKFIKLMNDIDLSAVCGETEGSWMPIGTVGGKPFNGTFDGGGHTISGLYINEAGKDFQGLFGYIYYAGAVQNLGVAGKVTGSKNVGGVAGEPMGADITNCYYLETSAICLSPQRTAMILKAGIWLTARN